MKITAFVGSARRKHTYNTTLQFIENLQRLGNVDFEIVCLNDYHIEICRGCKQCLDRGEELCPLKDDRDKLIDKMNSSDGVIFASPNYSFNVSGLMKVFLDRVAFIFHRPRFFGKVYTSIVVQGIYRGEKIVDYFNFVGNGFGYNVVKGCCLNTLEPMTIKNQEIIDKTIAKQSKKFYSALIKKELPVPSLFELMIFRMARTSIKILLDKTWRDYMYYTNKGWFESDFFYPVHLNPLKKAIGSFYDYLFTKIYSKKALANKILPV